MDLYNLSTDVATYVGAVSAGVSANALTGGAQKVITTLLARLGWRAGQPGLQVDEDLINRIHEIISADEALAAETAAVLGVSVNIDRSIVITASDVGDISQTNN